MFASSHHQRDVLAGLEVWAVHFHISPLPLQNDGTLSFICAFKNQLIYFPVQRMFDYGVNMKIFGSGISQNFAILS